MKQVIVDDIGYKEKYEQIDGQYSQFTHYPDEIINKYIPKSKKTCFIKIPYEYIEKFHSLWIRNFSTSSIFNKALAFFFMADKNEIVYYLNSNNDKITPKYKGQRINIRMYNEYWYNCRKFFINKSIGHKDIVYAALRYAIKNLEVFTLSFHYLPPYYNFLEYKEVEYKPKYIEKAQELRHRLKELSDDIFRMGLELRRDDLLPQQKDNKEKLLKMLKLEYDCFFKVDNRTTTKMIDMIAKNYHTHEYDTRIEIPATWYEVVLNKYKHYNQYNYLLIDKKDAIQKLITLYYRQIDLPIININDIKYKAKNLKVRNIRIKRKLLKSLQAHLYHIKSELTPYEWILKAFYILSNYQRYDINISVMLDNIYEKEHFDFAMLNKSEQLEFDDKTAYRFINTYNQNMKQIQPQIDEIKESANA